MHKRKRHVSFSHKSKLTHCYYPQKARLFFCVPLCASSVDGELDVGLLLVLQELRHPHGFVPAAQHALFDAGRLDLTDEALQRLQAAAAAAAEHCRVAHAGTGRPATRVLVRAVGPGVGGRDGRVELRLASRRRGEVMPVTGVQTGMGQGQPKVPEPGRACARRRCRLQHLRSVAVAVRGGHDTVPERGVVLSDGELAVQSGAGIRLPVRPVRQLGGGARQGQAGARRLSVAQTVHPHCSLLIGLLLDLMFVLPHRVVSLLQVAGFGHVGTLRRQHGSPRESEAALGRHPRAKVRVRVRHRSHGLQRGAGASLSPQLRGLAVGNSAHLPHQALNLRQLRLGGQARLPGGTKCLNGNVARLTQARVIRLVPVSRRVAVVQRIIIRQQRGVGAGVFSPPALAALHHTFDCHGGFDDGQQPPVASRVLVRIGAVVLACGVQPVDRFVQLFVLWHPDLRLKDFDGQWALGGPLGKSIQLCRRRVPRNHGGWLP